MKRFGDLACLALAAGLALPATGANAQGAAGYPNKAIRIIVPFAAGGGTDLMARNIAQKLNEAWKQPVLVENRTGAGGIIGADAAAKAAPDGQTDLLFSLSAECLPHVKSGKLRALAVTTETRIPQMADIPTTAEAGFPSVQATGWNGVMVPAATPREIVAKINAELGSIMGAPDMRARIVEQGFLSVTMSVPDTEKFVAADVERWGKVIREGGIKSE